MFLCKLSFSNLCTAMAWHLEKEKSFRRIDGFPTRTKYLNPAATLLLWYTMVTWCCQMMIYSLKKRHVTRILKSSRLKTSSDEEGCLLQGVFTLVRHVETNEVALLHKWQTQQPCLQILKVQMPTLMGTAGRLKSYNSVYIISTYSNCNSLSNLIVTSLQFEVQLQRVSKPMLHYRLP